MVVSVLYVLSPTRKYAGIERVVDEICEELSRRYVRELSITVLHLSKYVEHDLGSRSYDCRVHDVRGRLDLFKVTRREIANGNYDLIVIPQVEATVLTWLASLGLSRPLILYLHGNTDYENTHWKANVAFFLFRHLIIDQLRFVFGTSPRQLASFSTKFPSKVPRVWTPNPVRTFTLLRRDGRDEPTITFINVGRFCQQKGQDLLIDAFAKVHRTRPQTKLKLVGYGNEQADLAAKIHHLDVGAAVTLEHLPHDPQAALEEADVYVSASRWEGWGLTICEALRFGLPVVATDCEFGPSDILTDNRLGTLVPPGDVEGLAEAMVRHVDTHEQHRAFRTFRMDYARRFDASAVVEVHAAALLSAAAHAK